jgi:enamine deaminase RidA (YjgF/YER057c/UK114 family)
MSASATGAHQRDGVVKRLRRGVVPQTASQPPHSLSGNHDGASDPPGCSFVDLGDSTRVSFMLTPKGRGPFATQAAELLAIVTSVLRSHRDQPMTVTSQTVFLRDESDQEQCEKIFQEYYGAELPVINYVLQPPCCGAALALEAWAIGGPSVRVERFGRQTMAVSYDSVRWIYCAGVKPLLQSGGMYERASDLFRQLDAALAQAGGGLEQVVRTWFYLGGITDPEADGQRYFEFNRARSHAYGQVHFYRSLLEPGTNHPVFPVSTGIGMTGRGMMAGCAALQTGRADARLVQLENPLQTPAYAYHPRYSSESPRFSRALALRLGTYVTTWISGTASIVNSESRYPGDIRRQTEQTIDNIERLLTTENFALHGLPGVKAGLHDLAKIRVYLKRPEDFSACKAICERRFGSVPAIYAVADVCRPELLVEIEGVAFSKTSGV